MAAHNIVNYNLFGESHDLPDVVHCETIAVRAALHDWELTPHRHARLHQFLIARGGGGVARLEDRGLPLTPMRLVNIPTGAVHGFSLNSDSEGWVVTMASEIIDEILAPQEGLHQTLSRPFVAAASEELIAIAARIFDEFSSRHFGRAQVLRSLCGVLLGLVARAGADDGPASGARSANPLLKRFETLLEAHYREHWRVADYAGALSVSAAHLSRILRGATGLAASQLIQERIIQEARRNLVYTNFPVSSISYALGFDDPAYFSRVFAAATGLSPRAFRARLLAGALPVVADDEGQAS